MTNTNHSKQGAAPAQPLYASLELGRKSWLVTTLLPPSEKMSRRVVTGGDVRTLVGLLERLKAKAEEGMSAPVQVITIQEVGMDGFWIHRVLHEGSAAQRRTRSTARLSSVCSQPTSVASRGFAPWWSRRCRPRRTAAALDGSAVYS